MALTSYAVMVAALASAGRFGPNEVEVTKVVVGDNLAVSVGRYQPPA